MFSRTVAGVLAGVLHHHLVEPGQEVLAGQRVRRGGEGSVRRHPGKRFIPGGPARTRVRCVVYELQVAALQIACAALCATAASVAAALAEVRAHTFFSAAPGLAAAAATFRRGAAFWTAGTVRRGASCVANMSIIGASCEAPEYESASVAAASALPTCSACARQWVGIESREPLWVWQAAASSTPMGFGCLHCHAEHVQAPPRHAWEAVVLVVAGTEIVAANKAAKGAHLQAARPMAVPGLVRPPVGQVGTHNEQLQGAGQRRHGPEEHQVGDRHSAEGMQATSSTCQP